MAATIARRAPPRLFRRRLHNLVQRTLFLSRISLGSLNAQFEEAKTNLNTLKEDPGNEIKLRLYALFKQATIGKCNAPKPGMTDFVGKAKYNAWNKLGDMTQDEAQQKYINVVKELQSKESHSKPSTNAAQPSGKYQELLIDKKDGVFTITLNRPAKKNAANFQMYDELVLALEEAARDDSVIVAVTGAGDFFSSGNDLGNFSQVKPEEIPSLAKKGNFILRNFVGAFIDFPKPLIAVVNGPSVGIFVTILGLFDAVYAAERATFHTPFSSLGMTPEGCSSYIFPRLMGIAKASEVLLFGRKLTAREAYERNLVTEVIPDPVFSQEVQTKLRNFAKLPLQSLKKSKVLGRAQDKKVLHETNVRECDLLEERWQSEEFFNAIASFFSKKSQL